MAVLPVALWSWSNLAIDSDSGWGLPFASKKTRLLVGKFQQEQEVADLASQSGVLRDFFSLSLRDFFFFKHLFPLFLSFLV